MFMACPGHKQHKTRMTHVVRVFYLFFACPPQSVGIFPPSPPDIAHAHAMSHPAKPRVQFRIRIHRDADIAIGPGRIALLEAIVQTGSITAAAQHLGMSYRRAWLLIDELNRSLRRPAVESASGGARGGGTVVTEAGEEIIGRYRRIEAAAQAAAKDDIEALLAMLAP